MAHDADHALGKQPGTVRLCATRGDRRASFHRYACKRTRSWHHGSPETHGTTGCCIRSKSSRSYLHPFREGNGRTQRIFWTQLSAAAGYDLDWGKVTGAENDRASRAAMESQDLSGLREILDRSVEPTRPGSRLTPERIEQLRAFASLGQASPQSRSTASPTSARTSSHRRRTESREHGTGRDL